MNDKSAKYFVGNLVFERLFVGSKSEGLFPVLYTEINQKYRLHIKGESWREENFLIPYSGKIVKVLGLADNIRGHWRIVLDGGASSLIKEYSTTETALVPVETTALEQTLINGNQTEEVQ